MTALHWAVERGHISTVETLLRFGAEVTNDSKFGKTPLEVASDSGRPDIFEMLQNADQYRAPSHPPKSDAVTLAATQSILTDELGIEDPFHPITEQEIMSDLIEKPDEGNCKNFFCSQLKVNYLVRSILNSNTKVLT
jgi:hypothetical protein